MTDITQGTLVAREKAKLRKVLRRIDLVLFTVGAVSPAKPTRLWWPASRPARPHRAGLAGSPRTGGRCLSHPAKKR